MIIHVYLYGDGFSAGYLSLTTAEKNLDCILISTDIRRSDNENVRLGQASRIGNLSGNSISTYIETISPQGAYLIKRVTFMGNFNKDELSATATVNPTSRIEIRNVYGVLIWDNGLPLPDGTYPPDAKSRSGLSGLHVAPAVINPELETALMGDETNKERAEE